MRLKKSIVVLLILLISVPLLAGIAHSASPPTISASGGSGSDARVQGSSWTPNAAVTIYWDTEDANHKVAQVMTDYGGSFYVNFPLENQIVGVHTVIAVQGSRRATTTFNVGTTSPPDDRLLNPINSINNFLQNNIGSKLTSIDSKLNGIEDKLDNSATQMLRYYNAMYSFKSPGSTAPISIETDKPAVFIVSIALNFLDGSDKLQIFLLSSPGAGNVLEKFDVTTGGDFQSKEFTSAGYGILLTAETHNQLTVTWTVMVQGTPGTVVTVSDPSS